MRKIVVVLGFLLGLSTVQSAMAVIFPSNTGADTSARDFPGVGYLVNFVRPSGSSLCTAQAITPTVLITAAHCTESDSTSSGYFLWDLDNDGRFDGRRNIVATVDHPGWSNDGRTRRSISEFQHDIALVFLDSPLPLAVPIYKVANLFGVPTGLPVYIGGYGLQGTAGNPMGNADDGIDRRYGTNVIDSFAYGTLLGSVFNNKPVYNLRADGRPGDGHGYPEASISSGDSGGAVFTSSAFGTGYNIQRLNDFNITPKLQSNVPEIVAINSAGGNNQAPIGNTNTFVSVFAHMSWINDQLPVPLQVAGSLTQPNFATSPAAFTIAEATAEPDFFVPDNLQPVDAFPESAAAWLDEDGDGYPDSWAEGIHPDTEQVDGLYLDRFPDNPLYGLDSDRDYLPDEWEMDVFGDLTASNGQTDTDGDGVDDRREFRYMSDPFDGATPDYEEFYGTLSLIQFPQNSSDVVGVRVEDATQVETLSISGDADIYVYDAAKGNERTLVCTSLRSEPVDRCHLDPDAIYFAEITLSPGEFNYFRLTTYSSTPRFGKLLTNDAWELLALPFDPGDDATVASVFGESFPLDRYGDEWVLFQYNVGPASAGYEQLTLQSPVSAGVGYWIIQATGSSVVVVPPLSPVEVPVGNNLECAVLECYEYVLQGSGPIENSIQWELAGHPFVEAQNFTDVRVINSQPPCESGCTPDEAFSGDVVFNTVYTYDSFSNSYIAVDEAGALRAWQGFWIGQLPSSGGSVKLLHPDY